MTTLTSADQIEVFPQLRGYRGPILMDSRRSFSRFHCRLPVTLSRSDCTLTTGTVHNISLVGAMIGIDDVNAIPDEFYVEQLNNRQPLLFRVVWRKNGLLGVRRTFHNQFSERLVARANMPNYLTQ